MWASPKGNGFVAFLALVVAVLVPSAASAALSTVLASVESSLERCRATVTQHRSTLSTCTAARQPSPCVCLCPTCLPEEWPHRKEPPPCTTPKPLFFAPRKPTVPPPPPTAPPPPALPALKVLPPYYEVHLPTLGPFPATAAPTTTTLFPPDPPPGQCIDDGFYRGSGVYETIGKGLCVDEGNVAISFNKRRELNDVNFKCLCKEACDREPGCIGYSTNAVDDGNGLACRVYGWDFPTLVDRWIDLGSKDSPRYKGKKIVKADGANGMMCYRRKTTDTTMGEDAFRSEVENRAEKTNRRRRKQNLLQLRAVNFMPEAPPQISLVVRDTSTSDTLEWQREQLARCRDQEASLVSLLQQKGCRSSAVSSLRRQGRGLTMSSENIMPTECNCDCPACNFWQLPPPICSEALPPATSTVAPLPPGVVVVTGQPRAQTPPPMPVQMPLPNLPPIGQQFLPTLSPEPTKSDKGKQLL